MSRRAVLRSWLSRGSIAASFSALTACPCTEVGCGRDGLVVVVTPAEGERFTSNGRWVIEASTATQSFSCRARTNEGAAAQLESGCELPSVFGASTELSFVVPLDETAAAAGSVSVRVLESGGTLVDVMDVPFTTEALQPNGPHCAPTCLVADLALQARP